VNEKQLKIAKRLAWTLVGLNTLDLILSIRRLLKVSKEVPTLTTDIED
jgi:hypothetical protein